MRELSGASTYGDIRLQRTPLPRQLRTDRDTVRRHEVESPVRVRSGRAVASRIRFADREQALVLGVEHHRMRLALRVVADGEPGRAERAVDLHELELRFAESRDARGHRPRLPRRDLAFVQLHLLPRLLSRLRSAHVRTPADRDGLELLSAEI